MRQKHWLIDYAEKGTSAYELRLMYIGSVDSNLTFEGKSDKCKLDSISRDRKALIAAIEIANNDLS